MAEAQIREEEDVMSIKGWAIWIAAVIAISAAWILTLDETHRNGPTPALADDRRLSSGRFLTATSTIAIDTGCILATIMEETREVSVDWNCVEKSAAKYDPKNGGEFTTSVAVLLKAVRSGTARDISK